MLVLTRKQQEKIRIGNDITITVLRTKGKAVRLGIEAPANISVIRGELQFEHEPKAVVEAAGNEAELPQTLAVEVVRTASTAGRKGSEWLMKSEPSGATNRLPGVVTHQRVAREQVAQSFPGVAEGDSPLRAIMKRRSLSA
jgi:carbon storage regulator CsrA